MRKIIIAAAVAGAALILTGCSPEAGDDAGTSVESGMEVNTTTAPEGAENVSAEAGTRLDPNTASAAQLAGVEGITQAIAESIVAGRPYANATAFAAKLRETLPEEAAAAVLVHVFVPVNLNSASREEIALIPGMTPRMVGEFLEYRPYEDMNEFDREIGKYVDEAELARLRSYVTL